MTHELSKQGIKIVKHYIGEKDIGRKAPPNATFEKGYVTEEKDGVSISWSMNPGDGSNVEDYYAKISPVYTRSEDLRGFNIKGEAGVKGVPRLPSTKALEWALDKTQGKCSVSFAPNNKMDVTCSSATRVPAGRYEDLLYNERIVNTVGSRIGMARKRIDEFFL